ncbi:hypothetical protein EBR78_00230 [bacterium]|nr:hypothetical protein [bacterium]NBX81625.1 hypothetical protein [bacterium]
MLKRILALLAPGIFLFFTACGGESKPPQPKDAKIDPAILENLYQHAQQAKSTCSSDLAPIVAEIELLYNSSPVVPCGPGGAIPGNPGMPIPGAPVAGAPVPGAPVVGASGMASFDPFSVAIQVPGSAVIQQGYPTPGAPVCGVPNVPNFPTPKPKTDECQNAIKNLIASFITIKSEDGKVLYANDPAAQAWLAETLGSIMFSAGGSGERNPDQAGFMLAQAFKVGQGLAENSGSALPLQMMMCAVERGSCNLGAGGAALQIPTISSVPFANPASRDMFLNRFNRTLAGGV